MCYAQKDSLESLRLSPPVVWHVPYYLLTIVCECVPSSFLCGSSNALHLVYYCSGYTTLFIINMHIDNLWANGIWRSASIQLRICVSFTLIQPISLSLSLQTNRTVEINIGPNRFHLAVSAFIYYGDSVKFGKTEISFFFVVVDVCLTNGKKTVTKSRLSHTTIECVSLKRPSEDCRVHSMMWIMGNLCTQRTIKAENAFRQIVCGVSANEREEIAHTFTHCWHMRTKMEQKKNGRGINYDKTK